ncbi:MAG: DUF6385 domain-containing protein [Clostridia bacterium]|nr:DUF6385 domain-containing protein [Clostridia bacterium]
MPNNLIFSNVASELQVQIFGKNGSNVLPLQTDTSGNLVAVVATVSALTAGTVTVQGGTITTVSTVDTVNTVSALTAGTVTVQGGTINTVPIATTSFTTLELSTSTSNVLQMQTATQNIYSYYVVNLSETDTVTALLQISPVSTGTYFVNDTSTIVTLGPVSGGVTSKGVLVAAKYLQYTRLSLSASAGTPTVECYYNAHA